MKNLPHYLALLGILTFGTVLRFWHLDLKPLWMDEVITTLFSLGRSYNDIPLNIAFSLNYLEPIFTLKPGVTCPQIAHTVATQSTHPPLFFCLMYQWLKAINFDLLHSLTWKLRALPALAGVATIAAIYCLNRIAFSAAAGLTGAAIMAVSPFAVYLSQEARHYTLPMLLITLALLGFIQIQQDLSRQQQPSPFVWFFWIATNSISFYVHYFSIIAFIAQVITLITQKTEGRRQNVESRNKKRKIRGENTQCRNRNTENNLPISGLSTSPCIRVSPSPHSAFLLSSNIPLLLLPFAFCIPGMMTLIRYSSQGETDWLKLANPIAPLYQTLAGWLIFYIALPIEKQSLWIQIPAALLMIIFAGWLGRYLWLNVGQICSCYQTQETAKMLVSFIIIALIFFLIIVYILNKDITLAPRYNYVYFPALCALLGASCIKNNQIKLEQHKYTYSLFIILLVGILSSVFVTSNLAFQKPYHPHKAVKDMSLNSAIPLLVAVGYNNFQDVALGLSFALELRKVYPHSTPGVYLAFLQRNSLDTAPPISGYDTVWQSLSKLRDLPAGPLNLWVVGAGLGRPDYPLKLSLSDRSSKSYKMQRVCNIDLARYHTVGVSYQLYRCY
ncbi:glycosyltransferase family 39 protein [Kamptonema sp. UHCC 0994]|uniref:glycosyltransferase family 39 protein n=1 Tax=Kamptonema sp. UHCC 0994 TaxID=3031329 RepID=UPI0023BA0071|nr:glycosyltransferase family 39 protein [Kamptonema sp. UHCC 0994]MDF0551828.1 glycosyltransferase family 39 protein [Kamptonema sp. UHCC 0994]